MNMQIRNLHVRQMDKNAMSKLYFGTKIVSEYDQEIPQSQTTDNPMAPRGRAAQPNAKT